MTPEKLQEIGLMLYGSNWRPEMARALCVSRELVFQWVSGKRPVPVNRMHDIYQLCRAKWQGIWSVTPAEERSGWI